MSDEHYNISFRRALVDVKLREWLELIGKINNVTLDQERDMFRWDLNRTGTFSVHSMYLHLLNQHAPFLHKFIWKLKIPLKIKIFFWNLQRGIILTKDNLVRKNWKGSLKCCFCNANETIKHLLFDCHHAKQIWRIVYLATGLSPPKSVSHMFGNWLHILDDNMKKITMAGVAALCWAIWRCRNGIIFNKTKYSSFMQVTFRGTYWLVFWAQLQHDNTTKDLLRWMSSDIEGTALQMVNMGWKYHNRLL
jgi:hypothetical protein